MIGSLGTSTWVFMARQGVSKGCCIVDFASIVVFYHHWSQPYQSWACVDWCWLAVMTPVLGSTMRFQASYATPLLW